MEYEELIKEVRYCFCIVQEEKVERRGNAIFIPIIYRECSILNAYVIESYSDGRYKEKVRKKT